MITPGGYSVKNKLRRIMQGKKESINTVVGQTDYTVANIHTVAVTKVVMGQLELSEQDYEITNNTITLIEEPNEVLTLEIHYS